MGPKGFDSFRLTQTLLTFAPVKSAPMMILLRGFPLLVTHFGLGFRSFPENSYPLGLLLPLFQCAVCFGFLRLASTPWFFILEAFFLVFVVIICRWAPLFPGLVLSLPLPHFVFLGSGGVPIFDCGSFGPILGELS